MMMMLNDDDALMLMMMMIMIDADDNAPATSIVAAVKAPKPTVSLKLAVADMNRLFTLPTPSGAGDKLTIATPIITISKNRVCWPLLEQLCSWLDTMIRKDALNQLMQPDTFIDVRADPPKVVIKAPLSQCFKLILSGS
eukprot:24302-Karenia_brevis.AAC.1